MRKECLRPRGRFKAAGRVWRVRAAQGPPYDEARQRCMARIDWGKRRLLYDESLDRRPAVLAQLVATATGMIWEGSIDAGAGGATPHDDAGDAAAAAGPRVGTRGMRFRVGPRVYRVSVCVGALLEDGEPVDAITHDRTILICGLLDPRDRIGALLDQLRRAHEHHYGPLGGVAVASFTTDVMRQLRAQGDEPRLVRLAPGRAR
jgi:hypothetical protein